MKLISWNVNGLRACEGKGFSDIFKELNADFFCLQETKMQEGQLDLQFEGYQSYWNYAEKKGYSGTAIFTKHQPLNVTYGIGIEQHDHEGRVVTLEMKDFFLVCCYTPNSQDGLKRLDYRMSWEDDFRAYLKQLDGKKPVILCGDLNVAHEEIDLNSVLSIQSRSPIHGGHTVSKPVRRMLVGASTISSPANACVNALRMQKSIRKYWAATTVLLN